MKFTDDDLVFLKAHIAESEYRGVVSPLLSCFPKIRALIARMEAAEGCISLCCACHADCTCGNFEKVMKWRKVSGRHE